MLFIFALVALFLAWRALVMFDAYVTRTERDANLWRLLSLAFLGAPLRHFIVSRKRPGGTACPPSPPDWDDLPAKASERFR